MNRRALISIIFIIILVLSMSALFACDGNVDDADNLANRTIKSISIETTVGGTTITNDNPITLNRGEELVLADYTLRVVLDNDSEFTVPLNNGMFRTADELKLVANVGTHSLTVTYSLNNTEKNTMLYVVVNEPVVVKPKYTVTFDIGDGASYAEEIRSRELDSLNNPTPWVTYTDESKSYMVPEWYTSNTFSAATRITFPHPITQPTTIYAKWVDSRAISVEYYIMRKKDGKIVDANGDETTIENLPIEGTKLGYCVSGAVTAEPKSQVIVLSSAPIASGVGYSFSGEWLIFNYDSAVNDYETITRADLGGIEDLPVQEKYLENPSALSSTIKIYCVYNINSYHVSFANVNAVYTLALDNTLSVQNGMLTVGNNSYRIDRFGNVVVNNVNYHVIDNNVYVMTLDEQSAVNVTSGNGTVTVDGTNYSVKDGIAYQDNVNAWHNNVVYSGATPTHYIHTPYLIVSYNYQFTQDNMPYVLDRIAESGTWQLNQAMVTYPEYVENNMTFSANYTKKEYQVAFYRYDDSLMGVVTKQHGEQLDENDFAGIKLGTTSGYTFSWLIDNTPYASNSDLYGLTITTPVVIREKRITNSYTNTFCYNNGGNMIEITSQDASLATDFGQIVNRPSDSDIRRTLTQFDYAHYAFSWYTQVGNEDSLLKTDATQNDVAVTYYLVATDRRTLQLTITIPDDVSADLANNSKQDQAMSIGSSYTIAPESSLNLRYKAGYETDPSAYVIKKNDTSLTIPQSFIFNQTFINAYSQYMTYDETTFAYTAEIITPGKILSFNVIFIDEYDNSRTELKVEYNQKPVLVDFDTSSRTNQDGTLYHFAGWYNDNRTKYFAEFANVTSDNTTYRAVWRTEAEGSFGIVYEPYQYDANGDVVSYMMTGYEGYTTTVYVGSTYTVGDVTYPVTGIANTAFFLRGDNRAIEITSIVISSSIEYIQESTFVNCYHLESIVADSDNFIAIDGVLYKKNSNSDYTLLAYPTEKADTTYTVHQNTTTIAADALSVYKGNTIDLGSVKEIGARAFRGSMLEALTLPSTVESIGAEAFYNSTALATINATDNSIKFVGNNAFSGTAWMANQADTVMLADVLIAYTGADEQYTINAYAIAEGALVDRYIETLTIAGDSLDVKRIAQKAFKGCTFEQVVIENATLKQAIIDNETAVFGDSLVEEIL